MNIHNTIDSLSQNYIYHDNDPTDFKNSQTKNKLFIFYSQLYDIMKSLEGRDNMTQKEKAKCMVLFELKKIRVHHEELLEQGKEEDTPIPLINDIIELLNNLIAILEI